MPPQNSSLCKHIHTVMLILPVLVRVEVFSAPVAVRMQWAYSRTSCRGAFFASNIHIARHSRHTGLISGGSIYLHHLRPTCTFGGGRRFVVVAAEKKAEQVCSAAPKSAHPHPRCSLTHNQILNTLETPPTGRKTGSPT